MINNYAKNNLLPSPDKKKYSKEHVLTLLFIYYFKNIAFVWEDGRKYAIDKVSKPERCASRKAGGTGYRYTCQVGGKICHLTYEENYKWFMERK